MAIPSVLLSDTFDEWRVKTNTVATNFGDLTALNTTDKSSVVAAINEIFGNDSDDMEHLVDDATPQLGGHLDLNSKNVTGAGNISTTGNINITGSITAATIAGTVTGVTQSTGDNSLKLATTAYVDAQIGSQAASPNTALGGGVLTGTIANAGIANNAITSAMIAPGVIVAQDIATNAVNGTHIALGSDAAGDTMYYNGTDYVRLAKGTAGQVLSMNTGATAPEWSTAVTGNAVTMAIALG